MEKQVRKPDEMNSLEYLAEHLWEWGKRGGFRDEFETLKTVSPRLKRFKTLGELLHKIENGAIRVRDKVGTELCRLYSSAVRAKRVTADYSWQYPAKAGLPDYQNRADLRPETITVLLLILWLDLTKLYEELPKTSDDGELFAEIYGAVLERLDAADAPQTLSTLVKQLRDEFTGEDTEEDEITTADLTDTIAVVK